MSRELVGLTSSQARSRYRLHTTVLALVYLVAWLVSIRLDLSEAITDFHNARAPTYTALVEENEFAPGGVLLHWVNKYGKDAYGGIDTSDHYRPGQRVKVVDLSSQTCKTWETPQQQSDDVEAVAIGMFAIPTAGLITYLLYRRRWWRRVLESSRSGTPGVGTVVGHYSYGGRQGLKLNISGKTYFVPLLRAQFVSVLNSLDQLEPLAPIQPRVMLFKVAYTDRIVWPAGRYRRRLFPIGALTLRIAVICGPLLIPLLTHAFQVPPVKCWS